LYENLSTLSNQPLVLSFHVTIKTLSVCLFQWKGKEIDLNLFFGTRKVCQWWWASWWWFHNCRCIECQLHHYYDRNHMKLHHIYSNFQSCFHILNKRSGCRRNPLEPLQSVSCQSKISTFFFNDALAKWVRYVYQWQGFQANLIFPSKPENFSVQHLTILKLKYFLWISDRPVRENLCVVHEWQRKSLYSWHSE